MKNKTSVQKRTDRVRIASGPLRRYSKDTRYPEAARKAFGISAAMIEAALNHHGR